MECRRKIMRPFALLCAFALIFMTCLTSGNAMTAKAAPADENELAYVRAFMQARPFTTWNAEEINTLMPIMARAIQVWIVPEGSSVPILVGESTAINLTKGTKYIVVLTPGDIVGFVGWIPEKVAFGDATMIQDLHYDIATRTATFVAAKDGYVEVGVSVMNPVWGRVNPIGHQKIVMNQEVVRKDSPEYAAWVAAVAKERPAGGPSRGPSTAKPATPGTNNTTKPEDTGKPGTTNPGGTTDPNPGETTDPGTNPGDDEPTNEHTQANCPDKANNGPDWTCPTCGATGTKTEAPEPTDHVHDWSAQDGTCGGEGDCPGCPVDHAAILTTAKCPTCGGAGTKVEAPTHTQEECTEKANHTADDGWTCDICGATGTKETPATHVHDWSAQDGTCGGTIGTCDGCPEADGHADVLVGEKCPTCGLDGEKEAPVNHVHDWSAQDGTCGGEGDCPGCPDAADHANILTTAKCPTCGANGEAALTPDNCPVKDNHAQLHVDEACPEGCGFEGTLLYTEEECPNKENHAAMVIGRTCTLCPYEGQVDPADHEHVWQQDGSCTGCTETHAHDAAGVDYACSKCGKPVSEETCPKKEEHATLKIDKVCEICGKEGTELYTEADCPDAEAHDALMIDQTCGLCGKTGTTKYTAETCPKKDSHATLKIDKTCEFCDTEGTELYAEADCPNAGAHAALMIDQTCGLCGKAGTTKYATDVCPAKDDHNTLKLGETCEKCDFAGTQKHNPATCTKQAQHVTLYIDQTCDYCDTPGTLKYDKDACPVKENHENLAEGEECAKCNFKKETTPIHQHVWVNGVCSGEGDCPGCDNESNHPTTENPGTCPECKLKVDAPVVEHKHDWSKQDGTCSNKIGTCEGCPIAAGHGDVLVGAKCPTCGLDGTKPVIPEHTKTSAHVKGDFGETDGLCTKGCGLTKAEFQAACTENHAVLKIDQTCNVCDKVGTEKYTAETCPDATNHKSLAEGEECAKCNYVGQAATPAHTEASVHTKEDFDEDGTCTKGCDLTKAEFQGACTTKHEEIPVGEKCPDCDADGTKPVTPVHEHDWENGVCNNENCPGCENEANHPTTENPGECGTCGLKVEAQVPMHTQEECTEKANHTADDGWTCDICKATGTKVVCVNESNHENLYVGQKCECGYEGKKPCTEDHSLITPDETCKTCGAAGTKVVEGGDEGDEGEGGEVCENAGNHGTLAPGEKCPQCNYTAPVADVCEHVDVDEDGECDKCGESMTSEPEPGPDENETEIMSVDVNVGGVVLDDVVVGNEVKEEADASTETEVVNNQEIGEAQGVAEEKADETPVADTPVQEAAPAVEAIPVAAEPTPAAEVPAPVETTPVADAA